MARKTFTSRNRAFAALVRGRDNVIVTNAVDSAGAVEDIVDSAYIAARTTAGTDSAAIINLIDSAYVTARSTAGTDSAGVIGIIDSDYAFKLTKIRSTKKYHIQPTQPVITDVDEYWYKSDSDILYKSTPSTTLTTTMPPVTVDGTNSPYSGFRDYPAMYPSSATRTNISGTDAFGSTFTLGTTASAWFYFEGGPYPANPQNLNKGFYYNFDSAQDLRGIIIENGDPNAGRLERIDYEDGSYADNGFPGGGTVTFYNANGSSMGKTASANTTGNTFVDISHPNGKLATRIGFSQVGDYYSSNDVFLFFAGGRNWVQVGETDLIPIEDSAYDLGSPTKKWKDLYLSGNTIKLGVSRLSSLASGGLSVTDSSGAAAPISGSNIFDSAKIQGFIDSAYINARVDPFDSSHVINLVDSAYIALRDRFQDSSGIIAIVDSNYVQARQSAGGGGGVDSAATITLINSVIDSVGPSRVFTYTYTATANQTTFTGADNDSNTLAYSTGNIITFLNGILLVDSDDYVATTGSSIVLNSPASLNDILNVVKFRASGSGGNLSHEQYKYTVSSPTTTFSGNDDKGNSLSYETGELQVFLNGILLIDSQDYTASNGTSVVLTAATDSNDVLAISKYIGGGSGGGGGSGDAFRATHFVYTTATPTTTITGADDNSTTLSYIENQIQVFQNGILLIDSADYTATNGTSVVLGAATDSGDTVVITAFRGVISGGLDSAAVLAISGGGGTDSATVIALSGELKGGMFRINPQTLNINTTIDSAENAHVAGPISFDSGVVLTINGNLVIS